MHTYSGLEQSIRSDFSSFLYSQPSFKSTSRRQFKSVPFSLYLLQHSLATTLIQAIPAFHPSYFISLLTGLSASAVPLQQLNLSFKDINQVLLPPCLNPSNGFKSHSKSNKNLLQVYKIIQPPFNYSTPSHACFLLLAILQPQRPFFLFFEHSKLIAASGQESCLCLTHSPKYSDACLLIFQVVAHISLLLRGLCRLFHIELQSSLHPVILYFITLSYCLYSTCDYMKLIVLFVYIFTCLFSSFHESKCFVHLVHHCTSIS